jgi:hypothetical protein
MYFACVNEIGNPFKPSDGLNPKFRVHTAPKLVKETKILTAYATW